MFSQKYETLIFQFLISGFMSFLVSGVSTFRVSGADGFGLSLWLSAWLPAWAIAFPTLVFAGPAAKKLASKLIKTMH